MWHYTSCAPVYLQDKLGDDAKVETAATDTTEEVESGLNQLRSPLWPIKAVSYGAAARDHLT